MRGTFFRIEVKQEANGDEIPPLISDNNYITGDLGNSGINSEGSLDNSEIFDSSGVSEDSEQGDGSSVDNSSSSTENPGEPSLGSNDSNTHDTEPDSRPPQSSASSPSSEPTPSESGESTSTSSDSEPESSEETPSGTTSSDRESSSVPAESTPPYTPPSVPSTPSAPTVHTHTPVTHAVPATCTEAGCTTVKCSTCGAEISSKTLAPPGHNPETVTTPSTCTEHGREQQICQRCNGLLGDRELPLAEHTEITETEGNIETVKCSVCGEIITQTDLAAGITYPIKISGTFYEPVPQSIADSDVNNDGKLSLDECRAVTELSFGEGETESGAGALEQLVIFPNLENINITVRITDGNLSIGAIDGLIVDNISNVTGGTYPSDVPGMIRDIAAGAYLLQGM